MLATLRRRVNTVLPEDPSHRASAHTMPEMLVSRLLIALFGWVNPDQHREYKRLREENRRLRHALRESDQRGEHPGEEDHSQNPVSS